MASGYGDFHGFRDESASNRSQLLSPGGGEALQSIFE